MSVEAKMLLNAEIIGVPSLKGCAGR